MHNLDSLFNDAFTRCLRLDNLPTLRRTAHDLHPCLLRSIGNRATPDAIRVELAVHDPHDPGIHEQLEASPARERRHVRRRALDRRTAASRLINGVRLGVQRPLAVPIDHHVPHVVAVT
jgi:hypothetical protein